MSLRDVTLFPRCPWRGCMAYYACTKIYRISDTPSHMCRLGVRNSNHGEPITPITPTPTVFQPPVGTPLPTLVYVRLHWSKCVDRRRQGDIGTGLPTFAYVRLCQHTSRRHTSPKFVHSCRHTLVSQNFELTSMSAFKIISLLFPLLLIPQSLAQPVSPVDHAGRHQDLIFWKSLLISP
jgi:hypothetical protein